MRYFKNDLLSPTSRLDVMSHAADIVFETSNHTTRVFCRDATRGFNGNAPEIRNLPRDITSNLEVGQR